MIASVYFENRFEFYDLVVKRAALMLMSMVVVGAFFFVSLGWLEQLPAGPARPWFFAVALVPLAMVMPWLHARASDGWTACGWAANSRRSKRSSTCSPPCSRQPMKRR